MNFLNFPISAPLIPSSIPLNKKLTELEKLVKKPTANQQSITEKMKEILLVVANEGNLWKAFKGWARSINISKAELERTNVTKVAGLINSLVLKQQFKSFKNTLQSCVNLHSGRLSHAPFVLTSDVSSIFPEFNNRFIEEAVSKNYKKFCKILPLLHKYRSLQGSKKEKEFIETLIPRLQVWILQYLTKSSKIPLLEQRGPIHIPFLDYYLQNVPQYYRHDAGAITQLILSFIKEKYHLKNNENYLMEVIKPECFSSICSAACHIQNMKKVVVGDEEKVNLEDNTFYDISQLLQDEFAKDAGKGIQRIIDGLSNKVKSDPSILFGGVVNIEGQDYFFIFPQPAGESLAKQILSFRGSLGAIPETSQIRHQLIKAKFPLEALIKYSPIELNLTNLNEIPDVSGSVKDALKAIKVVQQHISSRPQTLVATHYLMMFGNILDIIKTCMQRDPNLQDNRHLGPLIQAIHHIGKRIGNIYQIDNLQQMNSGRKVQEILQEVNLAVEELSFILCFVDLIPESKSSSPLREAIRAIAPQRNLNDSLVCTSGMSAYRHVLEGLRDVYGKKFNVGLLEGSYYEIQSEQDFGGYLQQFTNPASVTLEDLLNKRQACDVISLDIYPNYVPLGKVRKTPLIEITERQLEKRTKDNPLILIVDVSTTMFWDHQVNNLVEKFSKDIQEGKLNVVIINSLAKFAMCGLDKYTGGIILTYNTFDLKSPFQAFNQHVKKATAKDFPSPEAEKFFYLFMQNGASLIKGYLKLINANTERMYQHLAPLQKKTSVIQVGQRDANVPMIGLAFENILRALFRHSEEIPIHQYRNLTHFMLYFLAAKSLKNELPISLRISFGFASTNFTECATALRMTIGLEDQNLIASFANMLKLEDQSIRQQLHSIKSLEILNLLRFVLDKEEGSSTNLLEWMESHKIILIDYAKDHSFLDVLQFIYNQIGPEKLFKEIAQDPENRPHHQWIVKNREFLWKFAKDHSDEEVKTFVKEKLIPLQKILNQKFEQSQQPFRKWLQDNQSLWMNFILNDDIKELKNYIDRVYIVHTVSINLIHHKYEGEKITPGFLKWVNDFKEKMTYLSKELSLEDLKAYMNDTVEKKLILLNLEKDFRSDKISISAIQFDTFIQELKEATTIFSSEEFRIFANKRLAEACQKKKSQKTTISQNIPEEQTLSRKKQKTKNLSKDMDETS